MRKRTKLYRNLKPGDMITVSVRHLNKNRSATVIVTAVNETKRGWFTNRRQWAVYGNYPWWFPGPIIAYSEERTEYIKAVYVERS